MTGREDPAIRSVALAQGAAGFIAKPFEDAVFLGAVRAALPPNPGGAVGRDGVVPRDGLPVGKLAIGGASAQRQRTEGTPRA
jgi:DNA-binding response OmpR family regulator